MSSGAPIGGKGVRFVELSCLTEKIGAGGAANPWDQHGALEKGHAAMAHQVDQPIAGLLQDLKVRGLLDETLVIWAGEFGRTPFLKEVMAGTTTLTAFRFGWREEVSRGVPFTAQPTISDITLPKTNVISMTCGQLYFIYLDWIMKT